MIAQQHRRTDELTEFRDRALTLRPGGDSNAWALAYAMLRLSSALEELAKTFAPPATPSFAIDHGLVRVARRLDELTKQLGVEPLAELVTRLIRSRHEPPPDPPEATEFLPSPYRRPRDSRGGSKHP